MLSEIIGSGRCLLNTKTKNSKKVVVNLYVARKRESRTEMRIKKSKFMVLINFETAEHVKTVCVAWVASTQC